MNSGTIACRYARALLMYTQNTGRGEEVCRQTRRILENPGLLHSEPLEQELWAIVSLLISNGRMELVRFVFRSFVEMYQESAGIRQVKLVSAEKDEELEDRIREILSREPGNSSIEISSVVDPGIIGGFIMETGGFRMDASVKTRLEKLRKALVHSR